MHAELIGCEWAHAEGVGTVRTEIYMRGSVLEAAVSANPRAVAEYAAAALLSMGPSDSDGSSLDALFNAMTPALACSSASARCSVASQVAASGMHLCAEAEAAAQAAHGDDLESRQHLAACVRQVAAAAVITRQQAFVSSLESALEALQRRPAAHEKSAEDGLLSLREQGAVLQHILLCPAPELPSTSELQQKVASGGFGAEPQQGCNVSQLLRVLQPLCSKYCAACSVAADGASCSDNAPLLPHWLPQQVPHIFSQDFLSCCMAVEHLPEAQCLLVLCSVLWQDRGVIILRYHRHKFPVGFANLHQFVGAV